MYENFISILQVLIIYSFCEKVMKRKYNTILTISLFFMQSIFANQLFRKIIENNYTIFALILTEGSLFIIMLFMYKDNLIKKSVVYTITYLTNKLLSSIGGICAMFILDILNINCSKEFVVYILDIIYCINLYIILCFLAEKMRVFSETFFRKAQFKVIIPSIIIMLLTSIIEIVVLKINTDSDLRVFNVTGTYLTAFLFFEFFVTGTLIIYIKYNIESEGTCIKYKDQNNYYKSLIEQEDRVRVIRHDMKNHFLCLNGLLLENKLEDAQAYLNKMLQFINNSEYEIRTGNHIADIILNNKRKIAEKNDIEFCCDFKINDLKFMDDFHLCMILGNSIDNAIEGCNRVKDKYICKKIIVKSVIHKRLLLIEVKNTYNKLKKFEKEFITEKLNKNKHGYGLKNIKKVLKIYGGKCEISADNEYFKIVMIIPVKEIDTSYNLKHTF